MQPGWQSPIPQHFTTQPLPSPSGQSGQGPQPGWGNYPLLMSPQPQTDWTYPASPYPAYPTGANYPQPEWNYLTVDYSMPPGGVDPSGLDYNNYVQIYQFSQNQFMNPFGASGTPPQGMPPQGMPPQGMPSQGRPPQGMPPPGQSPQGTPPQGPQSQDDAWAIEIIQNVFGLLMQCIQQLMLNGNGNGQSEQNKCDKKKNNDHKVNSDHQSHKKDSNKGM